MKKINPFILKTILLFIVAFFLISSCKKETVEVVKEVIKPEFTTVTLTKEVPPKTVTITKDSINWVQFSQEASEKFEAQWDRIPKKDRNPDLAEINTIKALAYTDSEIGNEYNRLKTMPIYAQINALPAQMEQIANAQASSIPKFADLIKPFSDLISNQITDPKVRDRILTLHQALAPKIDAEIAKINLSIAGKKVTDQVELEVSGIPNAYYDAATTLQEQTMFATDLNPEQKEALMMYATDLLQNADDLYYQIDNLSDDLKKVENGRTERIKWKPIIKKAAVFTVKKVLPVVAAVAAGALIGGGSAFLIKAALCTCIVQGILGKVGITLTKAAILKLATTVGKKAQTWVQGKVYCALIKDCTSCDPKDFYNSINACSVPPIVLKITELANKTLSSLGLNVQIPTPGKAIQMTVEKFLDISKLPPFKTTLNLASNNSNMTVTPSSLVVDPTNPASLQQTISITPNSLPLTGGEIAVTSPQMPPSEPLKVNLEPATTTAKVTDGLVLDLPFNGGNALDASGYANHGRIYGVRVGEDRKKRNGSNSALYEEGDVIVIPHHASLMPKEITVSYWVKTTDPDFTMLGKRVWGAPTPENWNSSVFGGETVGLGVKLVDCRPEGYEGGLGSSKISDNKWHHIVALFNGKEQKVRVYVDGVLIHISLKLRGNSMADCGDSELQIGRWWHMDARNFSGLLDDLRIYNRALTEAEIKLLYEE